MRRNRHRFAAAVGAAPGLRTPPTTRQPPDRRKAERWHSALPTFDSSS